MANRVQIRIEQRGPATYTALDGNFISLREGWFWPLWVIYERFVRGIWT